VWLWVFLIWVFFVRWWGGVCFVGGLVWVFAFLGLGGGVGFFVGCCWVVGGVSWGGWGVLAQVQFKRLFSFPPQSQLFSHGI